MPDAFVSALAGFVVVVGATLTRALTDRADRLSRLRTAYVDWFLALNQLITGSGHYDLADTHRSEMPRASDRTPEVPGPGLRAFDRSLAASHFGGCRRGRSDRSL